MSTRITLTAADGHKLEAWRSDPAGKPKGGVVVLHAIYGLTSHIGDVCDRWAASGYAAIAPALYDRLGKGLVHAYTGDGPAAGTKCYSSLGETQILADVAACSAAFGDGVPRVISGFCTGGTWAWVAATRQRFDAQVNFYGSHVATRVFDLEPRCPTVMHYGDTDHVVPMPDVERIRARHPAALVHVYPNAGHAFLNPEQANHDAAAAALAWQRSLAFLSERLGT